MGWLIKRGSDGGHFSFTFSWSRLDTNHHVREGRAQRRQSTRTSDCYWFSWKDRRHGWRTTWVQALASLKEAMTETVREENGDEVECGVKEPGFTGRTHREFGTSEVL